MKSFDLLLSTLLIVTLLSQALFAAITIQSQEFFVSGYSGYGGYNSGDSSVPVSGSSRGSLSGASSLAEDYKVSASAYSRDLDHYAAADASAEWTFTSSDDLFVFDVMSIYQYHFLPFLSLTDMTTNEILISQRYERTYGDTLSFDLESGHVYSLYISAYASAHGDEGGDSSDSFIDLNIHNEVINPFIPAPSPLLLGSLGVGFVTWLRRRKTL